MGMNNTAIARAIDAGHMMPLQYPQAHDLYAARIARSASNHWLVC
jgi:carboxypeptidase C (cathepsin A)